MNGDPLELVRSFVNTYDTETGEEELSSPPALVAWLAGRELLDVAARATGADVERARNVREALRDLLVANAGGPAPVGAHPTLDAQSRRSRIELRFGDRGPALEPGGRGVDGALGLVLGAVAEAMADGSWAQLKACLAEDCRWAFLDRSRNRSRRWCDMRVCGNRQKARTFRARHAR